MNIIQIKKHFVQSEFLKSKTIPEGHELTEKETDVIDYWIRRMTVIRESLKFRVSITDGLRVGDGTSQHFYDNDTSWCGAIDTRPTQKNNSDHFLKLGMALAADGEIMRVCYYTPSQRFPNGGFHCDCKGNEKILFINEGSEIDWKHVDETSFISRIQGHSVDIKEEK